MGFPPIFTSFVIKATLAPCISTLIVFTAVCSCSSSDWTYSHILLNGASNTDPSSNMYTNYSTTNSDWEHLFYLGFQVRSEVETVAMITGLVLVSFGISVKNPVQKVASILPNDL